LLCAEKWQFKKGYETNISLRQSLRKGGECEWAFPLWGNRRGL